MATINQLSSVDSVQGSDQVPIYDASNGDARKASMTVIQEFVNSAALTGSLLITNNLSDLANAATARANLGLRIGTDVLAYSDQVLYANQVNTFTAPQRWTVITDNDLSFNMNEGNNFICTLDGDAALTFTNITSGQSGNIIIDNSGTHTVTAAATTYIAGADLTAISAGNIFVLHYVSDGTNVYVTSSAALTSAGA